MQEQGKKNQPCNDIGEKNTDQDKLYVLLVPIPASQGPRRGSEFERKNRGQENHCTKVHFHYSLGPSVLNAQ